MNIHDCAAAGMTCRQAADAMGVNYNTAYQRARVAGLALSKGHLTADHYRECARQGLTRMETAERLGVHYNSVKDMADRYGLIFGPDRRHKLDFLTPEQRADYDALRRSKYKRAEALAALGVEA